MDLSQLLAVFGRLHPMVLHLPIGFLIAIAFLEILALIRRNPAAAAPAGLINLNALAGAVAVLSGLTLSAEPGYDDEALFWHKWLGIAVGIGSILIAIIGAVARRSAREPSGGAIPQSKIQNQKARVSSLSVYRFTLLATLALVMIGGHLGAEITHGENFVLAPLGGGSANPAGAGRRGTTPAPTAHDDSPTIANVALILSQRCSACHSAAKHKAGLSVETPADILKGGHAGPMIVAGKPDNSDLIRRLRLPADDDDHMPPKKKPQPTSDEIKLIEAWIAAGAPVGPGASVASTNGATRNGESPDDSDEPESKTAKAGGSKHADEPKPADPAAVTALQAALVHVSPLAQESHLLVVDFAAAQSTLSAAEIAGLLKPLAEQVVDLNLARCNLDEALLTEIGQMQRLRRLSLRGTELTDGHVKRIAKLPALEELIVVQTKLTDAALDVLAGLPKLKRVYLWSTGVTADALKAFLAQHADLTAELGDQLETAVLETEGDIQLVNAAAPPAAAPADLKPVNTVCPVSGKPLDPKYQILYDKKVIGFCCPNCPKEFWADPEKFIASLK